ncbi:MAG: hypothetical protein K2Q22_17555 [Cytophagales bacterium]|nr:hypothetical protein [Cytophagales bacterium]
MNFCGPNAFPQSRKSNPEATTLTSPAIKPNGTDTSTIRKDSSKVALKEQKQSGIKTTVVYTAEDSIRFDVPKNEVYLFGNSTITYGDINLKSDRVKINWKKNLMEAEGREDSATGKKIGEPIFKQGNDVYNAEKISYNFKTKKGIIGGIVTQQGEGYIHGEKVKKNQYDEMFVKNAKYTTCNMGHPHFYINAGKVKMVPGNKIVTGPFNMVVEDVPLPLGFVFGLFPMPKKRSAGIIIPTYGESAQQGFFLQNGGFFLPIGDYVGIKVTGNIWTVGSYGFQVSANYRLRYNFGGALNFVLNNRVNPNYIAENVPASSRDWALTWNHTPDTRGKTYSFSASVNLYTPAFNRNNSFNTNNFISSSFSSNITYSKTFKGTPFNMSVAARQDQNTVTKIENYNLPDIAVNMNRQSPFQNIPGISKELDFIKKLNIAYSFNFRNSFTNSFRYINTVTGQATNPLEVGNNLTNLKLDTSSYFSGRINGDEVWNRMNNGITHNIPISTTIKLLKHFSLNPSFNFKSTMYKDRLEWTTLRNRAQTQDSAYVSTLNRKASMINTYNLSLALTTRLYGTFYVKKLGIEAIRHSMIPTVSYNFAPDFSRDQFQGGFWGAGWEKLPSLSTTSSDMVWKSNYDNARYIMGGSPSRGATNSIGFGLNNTFEMKVKEKNDTTKKFKKVSLLDNLSLNTSYNFTALTNPWAPIALNARTRILGIIDLNFNSTFDSYLYSTNSLTGVKTRTTKGVFDNIDYSDPANSTIIDRSKFLNLTNMNMSLAVTLNPGVFKKLMNTKEEELTDEEKELKKRIKNNPTAYVDFNVPWNVSMMFNYVPNLGYGGFSATDVITLNFNGDFNLTPKWKIQFSSGYNFVQKQFTAPRFTIYRDLHCWQMNLTWIPFGPQQSYSMDLGIKATILQDLKYNKRRNDWFDNVGQ